MNMGMHETIKTHLFDMLISMPEGSICKPNPCHNPKEWEGVVGQYYTDSPNSNLEFPLKNHFCQIFNFTNLPVSNLLRDEDYGIKLADFIFHVHMAIVEEKKIGGAKARNYLAKLAKDLMSEIKLSSAAQERFYARLNRRLELDRQLSSTINVNTSAGIKAMTLNEYMSGPFPRQKYRNAPALPTYAIITEQYFDIAELLLDYSSNYDQVAEQILTKLNSKQGPDAIYNLFLIINHDLMLNNTFAKGRFYGALHLIINQDAYGQTNYHKNLDQFRALCQQNQNCAAILTRLDAKIKPNQNYYFEVYPEEKAKLKEDQKEISFTEAYNDTSLMPKYLEQQKRAQAKAFTWEAIVTKRNMIGLAVAALVPMIFLGLATFGLIPALGVAAFTLGSMGVSYGMLSLQLMYPVYKLGQKIGDAVEHFSPSKPKTEDEFEEKELEALKASVEKEKTEITLIKHKAAQQVESEQGQETGDPAPGQAQAQAQAAGPV